MTATARPAEYAAWIAKEAPAEPIRARGMCCSLTAAMLVPFPELRRARGHYVCPIWGKQEHWWCVAPNGAVVDPTAQQFPSAQRYPESAFGAYVELPDDAPEPMGKCMICGEYTWEGKSPHAFACSEDCRRALEAEYACGGD